MYLSAQLEHENSANVPVLQNARAVMTINSSAENHFPNATVRVIRLESYGDTINEGYYIERGAAGAEVWWLHHGSWVDARQYATHLCCLNEPNIKTEAQAWSASAFMLQWMTILDSRYKGKIKGIIGNFSQGTPEPEIARYFVDCNKYAYDHGHAWGFHSYWYPRLNPDQERWNYTRWYYWEQALRQLGGPTPEYMLTELGADGGTIGQIDKGWRDTGLTEQEYVADLSSFRSLVNEKGKFITYGFVFAASTWERFRSFEITPSQLQSVLNTNTQEESVTLPIDGRCMQPDEFDSYIAGLTWIYPRKKVFLHHTAIPTLAQWNGRASILAMRNTYQSWGWTAGPHIFAGPDGIWLFYDIRKDGRHAGGVYNNGSIGWEMVGNYDTSRPTGPVLSNTLAGIASLFRHLKLNPDTDLMFHRDVSTTHCPGLAVTKPWFVALLKAEIAHQDEAERPSYEWAYRWRMLKTPDHALYKYISSKGYELAGPEFWNEAEPEGGPAYQWAWDKTKDEYVLVSCTPPLWTCAEVMRMK